jgi:hypothetical protein
MLTAHHFVHVLRHRGTLPSGPGPSSDEEMAGVVFNNQLGFSKIKED